MSISSEKNEITDVVNRLLDSLSSMISSQVGEVGYLLRSQVGDLRANYFSFLMNGTFSVELLECFTIAMNGKVKLSNFIKVRDNLFLEDPVGDIPKLIVQAAIGLCLSTESRIIVATTFTSRDDAEDMIRVMKVAFDSARELAADAIDSKAYQALTFLAGALTNHLSNVALQLPRSVSFKMATSFPALYLSQRVYYNADRWEELVQENHVVNPAFCPREMRGLSS